MDLERLAACATGAAGAFYLLAAIVAVWRICKRGALIDRVIIDRAFAWSGIVWLLATLTLDILNWIASPWTIVSYAGSSVTILVAGLFSVRAITISNGVAALAVFGAIPTLTGVVIWLWG